MTGFANDWDWNYAAEVHPIWSARGLIAGSLIDVEHLVASIDGVLNAGASLYTPSIVLAPRPPVEG